MYLTKQFYLASLRRAEGTPSGHSCTATILFIKLNSSGVLIYSSFLFNRPKPVAIGILLPWSVPDYAIRTRPHLSLITHFLNSITTAVAIMLINASGINFFQPRFIN